MYFESIFHDATDQEKSLPGWRQEYRQVSIGGYDGRTSAIILPGVEILRETISVGTEQVFSAPEESFVFYYYPKQDQTELARGETVTGVSGFAMNWTNRVGFMDANSDLLMLVLKREAISHVNPARCGHNLEPPAQQAEFLADWLLCLLSTSCQSGISYDDKVVLVDLIHDRFELLLHNSIASETSPIASAERIYAKIRDRIHDAPDIPHTVKSLSRDLGIPAAQLRASSEGFAQTPLDKLLTLLRLNGARRDLLDAHGSTQKVSDIAMDWGFFHWGRFALRYRVLFGETPSQTLKK